jgi:uncharacterized protein YndB with AHSA1/START domain
MWSETKQFVGWQIGEAIRRCADPDLLSRWFADHRDWRAGGSRTRFSYRNEQIEGIEAAHHNDGERVSKALLAQDQLSYAQLKRSLIEHLLAGRLIGWGKRESPVANAICIPAQSWKYLQMNVGESIAIENTQAKSKIFDVRIFPMIESPDAIDRINGKTFVEAFQASVVSDPQLTVLRKRALAVHAQPASFGYDLVPYRAVWPAGFGRGAGTGALGFMRKFDEPLKYNREHAADGIVARRFAKLIQFLSKGRLISEGTPRGGGRSVIIPRSIWQRDRTYIDLENGDLLEINPRAEDETTMLSRPTFTGLMLLRPAAGSHVLESPKAAFHPERTPATTATARGVVTKTTSRDACKRWLCDLMQASLDRRPKPKEAYWQEAQQKWSGRLSKRAFDRVWNNAVEATGADKWSEGGRPRKPPQSKPPHQ